MHGGGGLLGAIGEIPISDTVACAGLCVSRRRISEGREGAHGPVAGLRARAYYKRSISAVCAQFCIPVEAASKKGCSLK
jgi:hypothetical protein